MGATSRQLKLVVAAGAGALAWLVVRSVRRRLRRQPATAAVRPVSRYPHGADDAAAPAPEPRAEAVVAGGIVRQRDKARAHVQFGQLLHKSGRLSKALAHFEEAVALDPQSARAQFELAETLQQIGEPARAAEHYERVIALKPACVEAATNLAVAYLAADRAEDAIRMCHHAIALQAARAAKADGDAAYAVNSEAHYNLNAALRACGRAAEAYEHTWASIVAHGGMRLGRVVFDSTAQPPSAASRVAGWLGVRPVAPKLTVVCVKWGSKYGAQYVNKLARAVRAHYTGALEFVCATDDASGLDASIAVASLSAAPAGWDGWWLKATLFGPHSVRSGRVVYLDLDTIIVGSLDELFACDAPFATLSADGWACERDNAQHGQGLNSSLMLWDAQHCATALAPVYEGLLGGHVFRHLLRFDHWLEMLLPPRRPRGAAANAPAPVGGWIECVQDAFPGQVVEYKSGCAGGLPEGARIVCFPRSPKPHEVTDEWAVAAWHNL